MIAKSVNFKTFPNNLPNSITRHLSNNFYYIMVPLSTTGKKYANYFLVPTMTRYPV